MEVNKDSFKFFQNKILSPKSKHRYISCNHGFHIQRNFTFVTSIGDLRDPLKPETQAVVGATPVGLVALDAHYVNIRRSIGMGLDLSRTTTRHIFGEGAAAGDGLSIGVDESGAPREVVRREAIK
mgnify:CR=1 FL=1